MLHKNIFSRKALKVLVQAVLFLGVAGTLGAQAQTTRERILDEGKVVIGIHNSAPWGFRDENGEPAGFHPDLIKAAFSKLGVTDVELVITEFGALIPGLTASRFDMIASGLYITPKRCELVSFSDPDLKLADAALVLKGNPKQIHSYADIAENSNVIFGAGRGSVTAKNAAAAGVPDKRILLFPNVQANVSALLANRTDAIAFSAPTVIRILADENIKGLERAVPFEGFIQENGRVKSGYSAIAFRQQDTDLRDLYNSRLMELKSDGTVKAIMAKYGFSDSETAPELTHVQICNGEG